ncbi:MAG: DUF4124 domain-containing protein [Geobacteraceae bacterium]|nr:DUF4124 domain-containing protein [Geobacteraceae bacterium]
MKQICAASLLLLISLSSAFAQTYSWTDNAGTVHFTEDMGRIPMEMRSKARVVVDAVTTSAEKPASGSAEILPGSAAAVGAGANAEKSLDDWKKELSGREAEMMVVRKKIDEIAAILKGYTGGWTEQNKLVEEFNVANSRLKDMLGEYFQQVEKARKAGLVVNIQE